MVIDSLINGKVSNYASQFNRKVDWTKTIAHRANIGGPNSEVENKPEQIDKCIDQGYDVEIDLTKS